MIDKSHRGEQTCSPIATICCCCSSSSSSCCYCNDNNNLNRLTLSEPFKPSSDPEGGRNLNEATKTTKTKTRTKTTAKQQLHSQISPILTREIVEMRNEETDRRMSGKLRALDQTFREACLQTSKVPIINHKEEDNDEYDDNDDEDEDKKCHLVHKIRPILQRHQKMKENFNETEFEKLAATASTVSEVSELTTTTTTKRKLLARCNELVESKNFFRIRQNMTNGRRKTAAFFYNKNKQKQKSVHHYQDRKKQTNFLTPTTTQPKMILKSIVLLFLMLSTNFYLSLGSSGNNNNDDEISIKNNNINNNNSYINNRQLVKPTKQLAAQATKSSTNNNNNNNNINSNNNHNLLVSNTKSTNLLKSKAISSTLIVENSGNNELIAPEAELIKRQAEDDINQPVLATTPTSELQAEARNGDFSDDSNSNNNNNNNEDNSNNSSDSDNLTQIPPEQTAATRTTTTTTTSPADLTTTKKTPLFSSWSSAFSGGGGSTKRSVPTSLRVTENELLPFSDFNVQQPAFSDLMKSWPPTTQQSASNSPFYHSSSSSQSSSSSSPYSRVSNANLQASRARHSSLPNYGARWQHNGPNNRPNTIITNLDESELMRQMRNHLNEDLDDTIITADQSFEQDQLPEPPTWINYLGELGDYIYLQLRQYLESFSYSNSNGRNRASTMSDQSNNDQDNDSNSSYQRQQQQQKEREQAQRRLKIETIDELLDDYYYDQYENSQVLYYGSQLVREGDIFEIGCYLPSDQSAEWTKSGRVLTSKASNAGGGVSILSSPRVIRRSDFLGAKQNYSLKVFEASLSDSGNYRCNKMSRKYHKLVVVPLKTTTTQLYLIQQRLLSIVNPSAVSMTGLSVGSRFNAIGLGFGLASSSKASQRYQIGSTSNNNNQAYYSQNNSAQRASLNQTKRYSSASSDYTMLPGYLIVENQPLVVNCNITDEFVLRRLRENSQFQLSWYKNSRLLRGSIANTNNNNNNHHSTSSSSNSGGYVLPATSTNNQSPIVSNGPTATNSRVGSRNNRIQLQSQQVGGAATSSRHTNLLGGTNQRIQYLQANGRQLYITSATYSDAGEYLCSWSNLPARHQPADLDGDGNELIGGDQQQQHHHHQTLPSTISNNFLSAGNLVQVMAPVKLRPFKSTYHVRQGNELRLVCFAQRGYPAAYISWYVGNRLVDGEFLNEHPNEFRILHLHNQNQLIGTYLYGNGSGGSNTNNKEDSSNQAGTSSSSSSANNNNVDKKKIVEINPIPLNRQQMQLTANGRGSWVEYRDFKNEKYAIETPEQQLKYLKQKLAQLMGSTAATSSSSSSSNSSPLSSNNSEEDSSLTSSSSAADYNSYLSALQTSVSVLVINSLNIDKHTSRYACRATTRANTDEVTTVVRVQASSTIPVRPSTGRATLIPGQPLHFQCETVGNKNAEFIWYRKALNEDGDQLIEPNNDENIEIHNDRLTLTKPTSRLVGDYYCRALKDDKSSTNPNEFAVIKVRMQPYIEDFGLETSHTGKSSVVTDGDRLELTCTVRDKSAPVNITWLRSMTPDDEKTMVPLPETSPSSLTNNNNFSPALSLASPFPSNSDPFSQTFTAPDQNVAITSIDSHSKKLVIESIRHEHRSYYVCMVDNGITERSRKIIFIRVKDKLVALWPFLGILAELFILFTIIHVWETQRAYKEIHATPPSLVAGTTAATTGGNAGKRPASGTSVAFENVPLTASG